MRQSKKLVKMRVVIEAYGYRKSDGGIALAATKPSRLLSVKEITQNSKEKMVESEDIF